MQESDMGLSSTETWLNETTSIIFFHSFFYPENFFLSLNIKKLEILLLARLCFSGSLIWAVLVSLCHYINISEIRY